MSERHYADWCKAKLGLSKEFEEGFNKGYEYAVNTLKQTSEVHAKINNRIEDDKTANNFMELATQITYQKGGISI